MQTLPAIYTLNETAELLKVSRREIGRMIERGEIEYDFNRRGHKLFSEKNIMKFIESIRI